MSETVVVPDYEELRRSIRAIGAVGSYIDTPTLRRDSVLEMVDRWITAAPSPAECCVPSAGEPSFVLLGRDPQAPALVTQWAADREAAKPDSDKPAKARNIAARMVAWKDTHPDVGMARAALATPSPSALRVAQEAVGAELRFLASCEAYDNALVRDPTQGRALLRRLADKLDARHE